MSIYDRQAPLISIIVPVYNVEDYVGYCLDSISSQTYSHFECVIVDDGSTDSSGKICEEFCLRDNRFRVIHQKNGGLGPARDSGRDASIGDYIWFVDSDDIVAPTALETLWEALRTGPYDISLIDYVRIDSNASSGPVSIDNKEPDLDTRVFSGLEAARKMLFGSPKERYLFSLCWNKLYSRSVIQDFRLIAITAGEDQHFNFRVYQQDIRVILVESVQYYWRQRANSLTFADNHKFRFTSFKSMFMLEESTRDGYGKSLRSVYLKKIYRMMVTNRFALLGSEYYPEYIAMCRPFRKRTIKEYRSDKKIGVADKIVGIAAWHFPRIGRILFKKMGN